MAGKNSSMGPVRTVSGDPRANPPALFPVSREMELLHPDFAAQVRYVVDGLEMEGIHMAVFEGYRSPGRQANLYAQGRTTGEKGKVVTYAQPWHSFHQYGLAVDVVGFVDGKWTWDCPSEWWLRLHQLGRMYELEPLEFEQPHLQLAGFRTEELLKGDLPGGGGQAWWANLVAQADGWKGRGGRAGVEYPDLEPRVVIPAAPPMEVES